MVFPITKWNIKYSLRTMFLMAFFMVPLLADAQEHGEHEVVILAINDVYRIEGVDGNQRGGMSLIRALRRQLEQETSNLLVLHAGDFLFPSLLSKWSDGAHMIEMMNALDGALGVHDPRMFVVFGNHEFDKSKEKHADLLQARIDQSEFHWLGSNIRFSQSHGKSVVSSNNVKHSKIVDMSGVRIGIFGLTTDTKPAHDIAYVENFLDPVAVAEVQTKLLRKQGAELVIALTHLSMKTDQKIFETLGERGPDLIIGGHGHQRQHIEMDGRWILKADADARTATVVRIRMIKEKPSIEFGYRFLDRNRLTPDFEMQRRVDRILIEHEEWFCSERGDEINCLKQILGETAIPLIGEELEIRNYETNLGNWVVDQFRGFDKDADIAFINAGSLRANQNIPPGSITQRHLEELLPYDSDLVRVELDRNQLDAVLERATEDWPGKGHWLQISGFAFTHDPGKAKGHRVDTIKLWQEGKLRELPKRPLRALTYKFLLEGGDGFNMLKSLKGISIGGELKERLRKNLEAKKKPIHPQVDGRICNLKEIDRRPCVFPIGTAQ